MTPQQLAEELERKVAAMNPPASEELAPATVSAQDSRPTVLTGQATAPSPGPVDMTPRTPKPTDSELASPVVVTGRATAPSGGLAGGLPFVAGQPAAAPAPAQQAPDVDTAPSSFADMIMQNDAVRLRNQEAFDRRERADRARLTLASITDALASLGNLVGTTQGSFNQPQTYQVPFVQKDVEDARAEARRYADLLMRTDQTLRLAQAREDAQDSAYALRQALEEERTRRAQLNNEARADLARQNAEAKVNYAGVQQGYRSELEAQRQAGRETLAGINNASREKQTAMRVGVSAANNIRNNERMSATGGRGGVGGYTTETTIHRDEYGQETGRTTTRTPANGGPSTTTTTGKKPNPMGSAPKQEGKKKKKNPMN